MYDIQNVSTLISQNWKIQEKTAAIIIPHLLSDNFEKLHPKLHEWPVTLIQQEKSEPY